MDIFPLAIFPQGSLNSSVVTTVWVGVFVVAFFNLRLGWVLSGLVVPGYLVPLILAKPWAAFSVFIEGVFTYILVWFISEYMSRWGKWSSFFGRDRFFALLLASVFVRIFFDGLLLPWIGMEINRWFNIDFDYLNNLHSFGLIIVALIANQFWKSGLMRGLIPFLVTVGVTLFLVRFILMDLTNFNIGNLGYIYEDIASSMLASPKAYIILIITAFIASRMNLTYGWEYSGILIPSLLALEWYQPLKIVTSFLEAGVILIIAMMVLQIPWLRGTTIEGARKILLFFNISFAYKMALAYLLLWLMPEVKITDYYGFGYLLPTLIAIKAHDKAITNRLASATLQVSLMGTVLASIVGFSLTLLPSVWLVSMPKHSAKSVEPVRMRDSSLIDVIRADKVFLYEKSIPDSVKQPSPQEIELFEKGIINIKSYIKNREPELLGEARRLLAQANYRIDEVGNRYLYLRENQPLNGWGFYVFDLKNPSGLVVEVPAPIDEWGTLESGAFLFQNFTGSALALAGSKRKTNRNQSSDVLTNPRTIFNSFHKAVGGRNVLQVRGYTGKSLRMLSGARPEQTDIELPQMESSLWIKSSLPAGLDLAKLKKLIGSYDIEWRDTPFINSQRNEARSGFAALYLNRQKRRTLVARSIIDADTPITTPDILKQDGYVQDWLLNRKVQIAERGTDKYISAKQEELLYFDEEVLTPLLRIIHKSYHSGRPHEKALEELRAVAAAASAFNYRISWFRDEQSGQDFVILSEKEDSSKPYYWGIYVFRMGASNPYIVEVPRPIFEMNSFEYGVFLFERLNAEVLLIAGAHPESNLDGSADVTRVQQRVNLFNLVNQVVLREAGDRPMMVVQSRAFGQSPDKVLPEADILLAMGDGSTDKAFLSQLGKKLLDVFEKDQLKVKFVEGTPGTAGYEVGGLPQARYLTQTTNKEFAMLWMSPLISSSYRQQTENDPEEAQFNALRIPTVEADLYQHLMASAVEKPFGQIPPDLYELVDGYLQNKDIVALQSMINTWSNFRFERVIDKNSKQSFLLIYRDSSRLPLVINLSPIIRDGTMGLKSEPVMIGNLDRDQVRRFIDSRVAWLELRGK